MISSVDGQGVAQYYDPKNKIWANTEDDSAYACCVACASNADCAAAAFDASLGAGKQCMVDTQGGETCSTYAPAAVLDGDAGSGMTIMNGNCGGFQRAL